jgi:hypothetical protein
MAIEGGGAETTGGDVRDISKRADHILFGLDTRRLIGAEIFRVAVKAFERAVIIRIAILSAADRSAVGGTIDVIVIPALRASRGCSGMAPLVSTATDTAIGAIRIER